MKLKKISKLGAGLLSLASMIAPYIARGEQLPIVQNGNPNVETKTSITDSLLELHPRIAAEVDHTRTKTTIHEPIDLGINNPITNEPLTWDRTHTEKTHLSTYKTTFGLGLGENGGWNNEFLRIYDFLETSDQGKSKWTEAAVKGKLNLGRLNNEVILFASFGDKVGLGFQSQHTLKDSSGNTSGVLTLNYEKANALEGNDPERYGFDLDIALRNEFPKVNLGGAFDRVTTQDDKIDYFLARARIQPKEADKFNLAYELTDSQVDGQTHTGIFVYSHLGKEEKWGTRTRLEGSVNSTTDTQTGKLEVYLVQNPASGHGWADAVTSRNNGDVRARNVVENSLDIELPTTAGRASKGFATRFLIDYKEVADADALKVRGEVGYTWDLGKSKTFSVMPYVEHINTLDELRGNEFGVDFNYSQPNMFAMLTVGKSKIGDVDETTAFIWIGKSFYFGGK